MGEEREGPPVNETVAAHRDGATPLPENPILRSARVNAEWILRPVAFDPRDLMRMNPKDRIRHNQGNGAKPELSAKETVGDVEV